MQRPQSNEKGDKSAVAVLDAAFAVKYPTILQYLTDDLWEDGKTRETSALAFTIADGGWQGALNDKALKQSCYTSGKSIVDVLGLMEKALAAGQVQWRSWKRGK